MNIYIHEENTNTCYLKVSKTYTLIYKTASYAEITWIPLQKGKSKRGWVRLRTVSCTDIFMCNMSIVALEIISY